MKPQLREQRGFWLIIQQSGGAHTHGDESNGKVYGCIFQVGSSPYKGAKTRMCVGVGSSDQATRAMAAQEYALEKAGRHM